MEIKVDALVLRTADYGESDRMLTLFTLQNGKLSAAAKGVRKAKARLNFAAQPFCFGEYVLAQKGERYTVISAFATDAFYGLRMDVGKLYAAASLAGLCDAVLPEGLVNEELFLLAVTALGEMCEKEETEALISFFLRLLTLSGYMIDLSACADCGAPLTGKPYFDFAGGCFTCENCARGSRVRESTFQLLRKCAGMEYDPAYILPEAGKRALRLLYLYFTRKTETQVKALSQYIEFL